MLSTNEKYPGFEVPDWYRFKNKAVEQAFSRFEGETLGKLFNLFEWENEVESEKITDEEIVLSVLGQVVASDLLRLDSKFELIPRVRKNNFIEWQDLIPERGRLRQAVRRGVNRGEILRMASNYRAIIRGDK